MAQVPELALDSLDHQEVGDAVHAAIGEVVTDGDLTLVFDSGRNDVYKGNRTISLDNNQVFLGVELDHYVFCSHLLRFVHLAEPGHVDGLVVPSEAVEQEDQMFGLLLSHDDGVMFAHQSYN